MVSPARRRVLHVDDNEPFVTMAADYLEHLNGSFEVSVETDPESALAALVRSEFDAVVSDYEMPEMDGAEFLDRARERVPDATLVLLTATDPDELTARPLPEGVVRLRKDRPSRSLATLADLLEARTCPGR